jgi:phage-related protein
MKGCEWRSSTKKDFKEWPLSQGVRVRFYDRLRDLQNSERDPPSVKWLGNIDPQIAEIKISGYRVIAYCGFEKMVYVLSAFKKDAAKGRQTRHHEIELIKSRLRELRAEQQPTSRRIH